MVTLSASLAALLAGAAPPEATADGYGPCGNGFQTLNSCKYESHKLVTTCFDNCQRVDLTVKWRGGTANSGTCNTGSGIDRWQVSTISVVRTTDGHVKWSGSTAYHSNGCPVTYSSPKLTIQQDHWVRIRWHHVDDQNPSYSFYTPSSGAHSMLVSVR